MPWMFKWSRKCWDVYWWKSYSPVETNGMWSTVMGTTGTWDGTNLKGHKICCAMLRIIIDYNLGSLTNRKCSVGTLYSTRSTLHSSKLPDGLDRCLSIANAANRPCMDWGMIVHSNFTVCHSCRATMVQLVFWTWNVPHTATGSFVLCNTTFNSLRNISCGGADDNAYKTLPSSWKYRYLKAYRSGSDCFCREHSVKSTTRIEDCITESSTKCNVPIIYTF
jgi:hypothetical protein